MTTALRDDFDAQGLRVLARQSKHAGQARRLLALAAIYVPGLLEQIARDQGIDAGRLEVWFCDEPYAAIPRAAHAEPWAASPVSVRRRS